MRVGRNLSFFLPLYYERLSLQLFDHIFYPDIDILCRMFLFQVLLARHLVARYHNSTEKKNVWRDEESIAEKFIFEWIVGNKIFVRLDTK